MKLTTMALLGGIGYAAYWLRKNGYLVLAVPKLEIGLGRANPSAQGNAPGAGWQSCLSQRGCIGRRARVAYAAIKAEYDRLSALPVTVDAQGRRWVTDRPVPGSFGQTASLDEMEQNLIILAQRVHGIKAGGGYSTIHPWAAQAKQAAHYTAAGSGGGI